MAPTCLSGSSMSTTCPTALRSRRYQVDRPITLPRNIWSCYCCHHGHIARKSDSAAALICAPAAANNPILLKREIMPRDDYCIIIAGQSPLLSPEMPPNIDMHISLDVLSCAPASTLLARDSLLRRHLWVHSDRDLTALAPSLPPGRTSPCLALPQHLTMPKNMA
jgi:hypothetical protein